MEYLNSIIDLIDDEKENISSNSYLQICNNLKHLSSKCFVKFENNPLLDTDTYIKNIYINEINKCKCNKLSRSDKKQIIQKFCYKYHLNYNVINENISLHTFKEKLKNDLNSLGPCIKKVFIEEFKYFFELEKKEILTNKLSCLYKRLEMFY